MSPTIRIDDDVYGLLKQHAEPFVDTPNSVLRRILGLPPGADGDGSDTSAGGSRSSKSPRARAGTMKSRASSNTRKRRPRAQAGSILPDTEYEMPILEILREKGGRAPSREVIDALEEQLDSRLTDTDREPLSSGELRWRNRAQFVRLNLVERGDMAKGSPRGVWEISTQGLDRLAPASPGWR